MPEGQDPSIHEQTPPVVDIPQILEDRVLQKGGHTISPATARALNKKFGVNLHHHEWGKFLEDMKADILPDGKRNDDHGTIMESGDCYSKNGQYLGNFGDYL